MKKIYIAGCGGMLGERAEVTSELLKLLNLENDIKIDIKL